MISSEKKLLELLSNKDVTFFIPPYQRNYEWDDEQCDVFFDDIVKTCEKNLDNKVGEHFFGSITYFSTEKSTWDPKELVLIDGQQRITTAMLFLAAFRDIQDDEKIKTIINDRYLKNQNAPEEKNEYKIKLKQVETDWPVYVHIILGVAIAEDEKNSRVYQNYKMFKDKLIKYAKQSKASINDLLEKGLNKFSVISIELQPDRNEWENPQEIFESMNSLGKPLSLADLVRNYLLLGFDRQKQEELYKKYWLNIEKTISGEISNYIRDFMQWQIKESCKKATDANHKALYRQFKDVFRNQGAEDILEKLSDNVRIYAYIIFGGNTGNKAIDYELRDLKTLRVTTAYSFLLACFNCWKNGGFTDSELVDILRTFRIYIIRRRIIGVTAAENKAFPRYVNYLEQVKVAKNKGDEMFSILTQQDNQLRLPNDIEVKRYLETANFYSSNTCKYILSLIEEKLTKSRPEDDMLQIEHIMPQKINDDWKAELGPNAREINDEYGNTIGNLTLIRHNQELGNKAFCEKKKVYENNAGLQIARKEITNKNKWDQNSIVNRTNWIIDYLLMDVLPIPEEMRKRNNYRMRSDRSNRFSFDELMLMGETIHFLQDPSITAKVVSDTEVEFEGKKWRLSPLTREIFIRKGTVNKSGSYQGAQYWAYDGIKLASLM